MTVHLHQSLASDYHLYFNQLRHNFHLSAKQALIPALRKTLNSIVDKDFVSLSGHLTNALNTSPFIDLIICHPQASFTEQIDNWGITSTSQAIGIVHSLQ